MTFPSHDEIRHTIEQSGCDLFAYFHEVAGGDPKADDECSVHSISHRSTELLCMGIRRSDLPAVSGLMTKIMKNWESEPARPGQACLALGSNLMLQVVEPPERFLDEIMQTAVPAAVDYRGSRDFSLLLLVPARRLSDREVERVMRTNEAD